MLDRTRPLSKTDLVSVLESLKLVVLGLVIASTHYKVVFLQDSRARLIIPIARIYFKKMTNTAVSLLVVTVNQLLDLLSNAEARLQ